MSDPVELALKLALRHETIVNALAQAIADHAKLLRHHLMQCSCGSPATMKHVRDERAMCDACVARHIVSHGAASVTYDDWEDDDCAPQVRRLNDLLEEIQHQADAVQVH